MIDPHSYPDKRMVDRVFICFACLVAFCAVLTLGYIGAVFYIVVKILQHFSIL